MTMPSKQSFVLLSKWKLIIKLQSRSVVKSHAMAVYEHIFIFHQNYYVEHE